MSNPESLTMDSPLTELEFGAAGIVAAVDPAHRAALAAQGIRPGVPLVVELDAPFGGPRIIRLGSTRLAVPRAIARGIRVATTPTPGPR